MSEARERLAAAIAVQMRTPLSRIELAASEIVRGAGTPREASLASRVAQSVAQLDRLIAHALTVLRPHRPAANHDDLWPALEALHARYAPVLQVSGVSWRRVAPPLNAIAGDPVRLRQAGIRLLRAPRSASPLSMSLSLVGDEHRYGLALALEARPGAAPPALSASVRDELRTFALGCGGLLDEESGEHGRSLTLWLPRSESTCSAF